MKLPSLRGACLSSRLHKSIRLGSVQTANLEVEATHGPLKHSADLGAKLIPDLEFDQTLDWCNRTAEGILLALWRARVCASF